ncbi:MAG: 23S rRNA (uridine(2552)-2'-O)-methyltransferase RlmE [Pseudomonadota bacterium]|nr:23S rRNA (uridine(2552)-2'-O)-methyltransferase RlmE [Pseudomonadota bacterium]
MARSKSSREWLDRHLNDEYVQKARVDGYRSRAVYKLLEIQHKDQLIQPGDVVVDLGAAPGGWSQVAHELVGEKGAVFALDILPMDAIAGVTFIEGDFREQQPLDKLCDALKGRDVDLVISDMAPNLSGMASVDQPRSIYLCELALDFAVQTLKPGGSFLTKIFQGEGFDAYMRLVRENFASVVTRKPQSSRSKSSEVYLIGHDFRV